MNTLKAIKEVLTPVAATVTRVSEDREFPYVFIKQLPGLPTGRSWEAVDRVEVEIWAEGYGPAFDLAKEAGEILRGYQETSYGLIDLIEAEVPFWHEPTDSDKHNKFSGTFLVTYRT